MSTENDQNGEAGKINSQSSGRWKSLETKFELSYPSLRSKFCDQKLWTKLKFETITDQPTDKGGYTVHCTRLPVTGSRYRVLKYHWKNGSWQWKRDGLTGQIVYSIVVVGGLWNYVQFIIHHKSTLKWFQHAIITAVNDLADCTHLFFMCTIFSRLQAVF